jgi:lipoprotein-releasing system permease protein
MSNGVLIQIAKTHLLTRKKQSAIASLGVTFGIGTFIVLVSFMTGLNGLLDGLISNRTPHVRIYNEVKPSLVQPIEKSTKYKGRVNMIHSIKPKQELRSVRNSLPLMAVLKKNALIQGATPQVAVRVFYQSGSIIINGNANGIDALEEDRLFNFRQYVVGANPSDLSNNENGIMLGIGVAKKLSLSVGDRITILNSTGATFRLKIVGFFQSGLADLDQIQSYVNVKMAQRIAGQGNNFITDISVKLYDIEKAKYMSDQIAKTYGVNSIDIKTANAQFETSTSIRNIITYAVSITLLIVAGFGIYNILNMVIYEKMNDIAILKATGFSGSDVKKIFIYQAMFIGIVGGLLGLLLGGVMSYVVSKTPFETEAIPTVKTFPVNFDPLFYLIGSVFALITTFFAGYLPAKKASKIDPVDIIRGQ